MNNATSTLEVEKNMQGNKVKRYSKLKYSRTVHLI